MSERKRAVRAAILTIAVAGAGAAHAQNAVEANGPLTLTEAPTPLVSPIIHFDRAANVAADPSTSGEVAGAADHKSLATNVADLPRPAVPVSAIVPAAAAKDPPAIEHKSLGQPTSTIAGNLAAADSSKKTQGMFERLDPRSNEVMRVAGAMAVVLGLLLLVRTALRRFGGLAANGSRPSGVLEILARYPVARGQQFLLIKLARRIVLLHQSGSNVTTISEIVDENEVAGLLSRMEAGSNLHAAAKFRKTLNEFLTQHEDDATPPSRSTPRDLPPTEAELVDLTRQNRGMWSRFFNRKGETT